MNKETKYSKNAWTIEEDALLKIIVEQQGAANWSNIANHIPERTPKQCRERWHQHLDSKIRKGDWTNEEDGIILKIQQQIGNQWSKMAALLNGRADVDVKNRFYKLQRFGIKSSLESTPEKTELDGNDPRIDHNDSYDSIRSSKSLRGSLRSTPRTFICEPLDEITLSTSPTESGIYISNGGLNKIVSDRNNMLVRSCNDTCDSSDTTSRVAVECNESCSSDISTISWTSRENYFVLPLPMNLSTNAFPFAKSTSIDILPAPSLNLKSNTFLGADKKLEKFFGLPLIIPTKINSSLITKNACIERFPIHQVEISRSSSCTTENSNTCLSRTSSYGTENDLGRFTASSSALAQHVEQEILDILASDIDHMSFHTSEHQKHINASPNQSMNSQRVESSLGLWHRPFYTSEC